ncbi:MAG: acyl-CoA dehydrogenase family protein [Anaerolineae bacterium]|nr:acyl-CoA dehydrogenase family protein [Anaerolineae bacterium]
MNFTLSSTQQELVASARTFALAEVAPFAAQWDADEAVPRSHVQKLADAGYFGMTLPIEYGGRGLTTLDAILVIEEIAKQCAISGRLIVDHNFGAVGTILNFGTEEQRQRVLPTVARGEKLISIGMTEPEIGSALTDLTTAARVEGDTIILNGRKRWITGAGEREYTLVYARFDAVPGAKGIGALLVEQGYPGYRPGPRIPTLGVRGVREGELIFEDARIPLANLVVPPGSGFGRLMSTYNGQRVGASAVALGIAQGAFDYALAYADNREQFGRKLTDFQAIQFKLADMTMELEAARWLIYRAATNAKKTIADRYESSVCKVVSAEMAIHVTNAAMQLLGGNGYSREHPLERMLRDARMFTFGGGSSEIQRIGIASHILGRPLPQHREP